MANKMTYAKITIGDLLDTYLCAELLDNFEGIVCDSLRPNGHPISKIPAKIK